jgi:large subunit ribosomal protein L15
MRLHELKPPEGARRARRRVGRGEGSGRGKTAGRGTKGTRARGSVPLFFEGGQMPLVRRLPKRKGFKPINRVVYGTVNVSDLERIESSEIGPSELRSSGLVHKRDKLIKILGQGDIGRAVTVRAHAFSATARQKIEAAGGKVEVLEQGRSEA